MSLSQPDSARELAPSVAAGLQEPPAPLSKCVTFSGAVFGMRPIAVLLVPDYCLAMLVGGLACVK